MKGSKEAIGSLQVILRMCFGKPYGAPGIGVLILLLANTDSITATIASTIHDNSNDNVLRKCLGKLWGVSW